MIAIRPYSAECSDAVASLILHIQQEEFQIPVTIDDQPDLLDIQNFYQTRQGNFWTALDDGVVVGTIGLLDIGAGQGALRKMFVAKSHRGPGGAVAKRLLEQLLAWAGAHGYTDVFLGTTAKFLAAHRFYEKNGFREIAMAQLPASFPVMKVDTKFYRYAL
jgi:GNAT superfamily N-acetyltransferase